MDLDSIVERFRKAPSSTEGLRAERKSLSHSICSRDRAEVLALALALIRARVPRFVAYEIILHHQPTLTTLTPDEVQQLGEGITHWGDVDSFSCFVTGPAWRAGAIPDRLIKQWARSEDWCWRRTALVSTVPLNARSRGGSGDTKRTLSVCRLFVADHHDMVEKALSWALRELAKRDPECVRSFLAQHESELGARVKREVNNKLTTGLKNPRNPRPVPLPDALR